MENLNHQEWVGQAFEDLTFEEMQLSQGHNEIEERISTPFVVSGTITFISGASITAWTR